MASSPIVACNAEVTFCGHLAFRVDGRGVKDPIHEELGSSLSDFDFDIVDSALLHEDLIRSSQDRGKPSEELSSEGEASTVRGEEPVQGRGVVVSFPLYFLLCENAVDHLDMAEAVRLKPYGKRQSVRFLTPVVSVVGIDRWDPVCKGPSGCIPLGNLLGGNLLARSLCLILGWFLRASHLSTYYKLDYNFGSLQFLI